MALFDRLHGEGHTIVLVTHEHDIADFSSRIVSFRDGHVVDTTVVGTPRFSPTLLLRTIGRRSGTPQVAPLTYGLFGYGLHPLY